VTERDRIDSEIKGPQPRRGAAAGTRGAAEAIGRATVRFTLFIGKLFLAAIILWTLLVVIDGSNVGGSVVKRIDFYGRHAFIWAVPAYFAYSLWRHWAYLQSPKR
jgi:hypothetical protein